MAYVRRRGNQLAIVQGEREPGSGKVQQRILFTIYSQLEARAILGERTKGSDVSFERLLESEHPEIRFNWEEIRRGIRKNLETLPDLAPIPPERFHKPFRDALCAFTRELVLADPQDLMPAARLIQDYALELRYLQDLIDWRLKLMEQKPHQFNQDNRFLWRFSMRSQSVPPDTEEHAAGYYERGEHREARAIFQLLVESFEGYAEGYNYLGLIALEEDKVDEAIAHFQKTVEHGRKLFPKRLSKKLYWQDYKTRPYMRGLMNLALSLNRVGRYEEALVICDRLETECGDLFGAEHHRAAIFLNTRSWESALQSAKRASGEISPSLSYPEAFALYELGRLDEALLTFLYLALNKPIATRLVLGAKNTKPTSIDEARDYNNGVSELQAMQGYLRGKSQKAQQFFRRVLRDPRVNGLVDDVIALGRSKENEHFEGRKAILDRMARMRSGAFANEEALKLQDLLPKPKSRK